MVTQRMMEESEKKPSFRDFAVEKKAWASDGYALELGDVKPLPGSGITSLNDEGVEETQSLHIKGKNDFDVEGESDRGRNFLFPPRYRLPTPFMCIVDDHLQWEFNEDEHPGSFNFTCQQ